MKKTLFLAALLMIGFLAVSCQAKTETGTFENKTGKPLIYEFSAGW